MSGEAACSRTESRRHFRTRPSRTALPIYGTSVTLPRALCVSLFRTPGKGVRRAALPMCAARNRPPFRRGADPALPPARPLPRPPMPIPRAALLRDHPRRRKSAVFSVFATNSRLFAPICADFARFSRVRAPHATLCKTRRATVSASAQAQADETRADAPRRRPGRPLPRALPRFPPKKGPPARPAAPHSAALRPCATLFPAPRNRHAARPRACPYPLRRPVRPAASQLCSPVSPGICLFA